MPTQVRTKNLENFNFASFPSCQVEVMKHDDERNFTEAHVLCSHCIVSFALLSQHKGERESRSEVGFIMSSPSHLSLTSPCVPSQLKEISLGERKSFFLDYSAANPS